MVFSASVAGSSCFATATRTGPSTCEAGAGPYPTIGTERRLIRRNRMGAGSVMWDRIGAWQGTRRHVGFLVGTLRPQTIGSGINGDLAIDAEDLALPVGIGRYPIMMIAGVSAGQQRFVALLDPAHRVIQLERQRGEDDFLGIEPGLWPEFTTHIGRDDWIQHSSSPRISPSATRIMCGAAAELGVTPSAVSQAVRSRRAPAQRSSSAQRAASA